MITLYPKDWQFRVGVVAGGCVVLAGALLVHGLWIVALIFAVVSLSSTALAAWLSTREA